MHGVITDRLIETFGHNVGAWPAYRGADAKPMPDNGVKGIALGGRPGRKAQARRNGFPEDRSFTSPGSVCDGRLPTSPDCPRRSTMNQPTARPTLKTHEGTNKLVRKLTGEVASRRRRPTHDQLIQAMIRLSKLHPDELDQLLDQLDAEEPRE